MRAAGYVYVLTNPALPGLLKIGKTTRTPQLRAAELSKPTGVPRPFEVAYALFVMDCHRVEKRMHGQLSRTRVRGREFFELPLCEAIAALDEVGARYLPTATRARHRLRRILGDTLGDLVSGLVSLVWFVIRAALGLLSDVALSVGSVVAKVLLVGALLFWLIHSPPGCLRGLGSYDTPNERSQSRRECQTSECKAKLRKKRARDARKAAGRRSRKEHVQPKAQAP